VLLRASSSPSVIFHHQTKGQITKLDAVEKKGCVASTSSTPPRQPEQAIVPVTRLQPHPIHASRRLDGTMNTASDDNADDSFPAACHILRLPPELFSKIVSYIFPIRPGHDDFDRLPFLETLRTFRSVCRTFRWFADNLPFWYEASFQVDMLYPGSITQENLVDAVRYIEGFLGDGHLRECLGRRKREWNFDFSILWRRLYLPLWEMLARTIPGFKENAESLTGFRFRPPPNLPPELNLDELLKEFPQLRTLSFASGGARVHAENIPAPLRRLSVLSCLPMRKECTCSFNGVRNLEYFRHGYNFNDSGRTPAQVCLDRLLPIKSCTTLRTLALGPYSTQCPIGHGPLGIFCNLKELEINVSSPALFQYLATSPLRLEVIKFIISTSEALQAFVPAIESPSLRSLKQCGLYSDIIEQDWDTGGLHPTVISAWELVVKAIAGLPLLEIIDLTAPIHEAWSFYFQRSRHLQVLVWRMTHGYDLGEELHEFRRTFASALLHIYPTPRVVIVNGDKISGADDQPWWNTRPQQWWRVGNYL
jgi:hypothetical protein